jgi:pyruvate formate lyase activating enzyme
MALAAAHALRSSPAASQLLRGGGPPRSRAAFCAHASAAQTHAAPPPPLRQHLYYQRRGFTSSSRIASAAASAAAAAASAAPAPQQHEETAAADAIPEVFGRLHSTESFSAVDGPGVRFVAFLQGCAMRCAFCSNPDSWAMGGGEVVSSKELAEQIARVLPYLKSGGGGLTCSGGEPLLQPEFAAALFREAHALGLTTTLDTTGQGTKHKHWDVVLPHTDGVLFCIKALDPAK